jgi:tetratricopeptide (TPR) repeat protein
LGRIQLALGNPAAADDVLSAIDDSASLSDRDRLALGHAWLELQRWARLFAVVAEIPEELPVDLQAERSFLQAVAAIQQDQRLPEALAALDYLSDPATRRPPASALASLDTIGGPLLPSACEIATWRGVALMRGGQLDAARDALDEAIALQADRPEAYYWRGLLAERAGQRDIADMYLRNALATDARYAPAWEALGSLALNRGDLAAALQDLDNAVAANQRSATAHFLIAIVHAKASRRDQAAAALRAAFALDPTYLEVASQTDVLARLFTPQDLLALAAPPEEVPETQPAEGAKQR